MKSGWDVHVQARIQRGVTGVETPPQNCDFLDFY